VLLVLRTLFLGFAVIGASLLLVLRTLFGCAVIGASLLLVLHTLFGFALFVVICTSCVNWPCLPQASSRYHHITTSPHHHIIKSPNQVPHF
jgi:hypothetical protein